MKTLSGSPLAFQLVSWTCRRTIHASSCRAFWKKKNTQKKHAHISRVFCQTSQGFSSHVHCSQMQLSNNVPMWSASYQMGKCVIIWGGCDTNMLEQPHCNIQIQFHMWLKVWQCPGWERGLGAALAAFRYLCTAVGCCCGGWWLNVFNQSQPDV